MAKVGDNMSQAQWAGQGALSLWRPIEGIFSGIGHTFTGIFGGGFDYSNADIDFVNAGVAFHNSVYGGDTGSKFTESKQFTVGQRAQQMTASRQAWTVNAYNPESAGNKGLNPNGAKASDLAAISDPSSKVAIASSRGKARSVVHHIMGGTNPTPGAPSANQPGATSGQNTT